MVMHATLCGPSEHRRKYGCKHDAPKEEPTLQWENDPKFLKAYEKHRILLKKAEVLEMKARAVIRQAEEKYKAKLLP